jgi:hypothetical protein
VYAFLRISDPLPLRDFFQVIVVQDGRDIEPKVEVDLLRFEINLEVTPHFLVKIVQVEHKEVFYDLFTRFVGWLGLFPLENLIHFDLHIIVHCPLLPIIEVENWFDWVLLGFALTSSLRIRVILLCNLHVAYNKVKVDLILEWTETDGVEVDYLVTHVLKDSILGQIVVVPQRKLEECHVLLLSHLSFISQLVVQKATEELDVALLRVDCESFAVLGALLIVVCNSVVMSLEHTKVDQQGAYHHASATLASFAMDDNHGLYGAATLWLLHASSHLVILLHALQE